MKLLIIYAYDPLGRKIGGEGSFIKGFIKNSPSDMEVELIGITSDHARPLRCWSEVKLGNKKFKFFPVFFEKDENKRRIIPLAIRFIFALQACKINYSERVLFFNRLDTASLFHNMPNSKVVVVHNDIEKQIKNKGSESLWSRVPYLYFKLERYIFSFMDQIYTVSQNSLAFYQKEYPQLKDRISFLTTWVEDEIFKPTEFFKDALRKELGFTDDDKQGKWILFVGRLQEQKAPLRLVETFNFYAQTDSSARLIIIGEGNMKSKVEEDIQRRGLRQQVIFLNGMTQEKLVKFYQAADVLILTSNFEGMPMSVLEALGCGLPVVTTDVGEVRLVVMGGFSGEIVTGFEPIDIARVLKKVLASSQVYSPENCLRSVKEYTPLQVLAPVYKRIKEINETVAV